MWYKISVFFVRESGFKSDWHGIHGNFENSELKGYDGESTSSPPSIESRRCWKGDGGACRLFRFRSCGEGSRAGKNTPEPAEERRESGSFWAVLSVIRTARSSR